MSNLKLYCDDAYNVVAMMKKNNMVVSHIITDPPYNISKNNNFTTMRHPRKGVNFGEWDSGAFDLCAWIPEFSKILDKNGSMIIFCSYRYISRIIDCLESTETGMIVKDIIVWQKSNPMPRNISRRYVQDMEFAIWAVKKGSKWVFNKQENMPYMRAMYKTSVVGGKEKLGHPTQKSLQLMKEIISVHTNENDVILDPFMGCGSTGAAALELGRRFVGIEIDKDYFAMAEKRLKLYELEKGGFR